MKYDILCAGLATYDTILSPVSASLFESDGAMVDYVYTGSGGDAVNSAISMAKLGIRVCVAACVGEDSFAEIIQADLRRAGASTEGVVRDKNVFTNSPVVLVTDKGERHIIRTAKGGNRFFSRDHITRELLSEAGHLHIASINMIPMLDGEPLAELFETAHEMGLTTSMDASFDKSGLWMKRIERVLPHCDIFIPSLQEATHYANSNNLEDITEVFSKYSLKYFGVKLGADGVYVTDFKQKHFIPSLYEGIPVDTTGAGDAFFAGFLSGYVKSLDLKSCAILGSAQSASVISSVGANRSAATLAQSMNYLKDHGQTLYTLRGEKYE